MSSFSIDTLCLIEFLNKFEKKTIKPFISMSELYNFDKSTNSGEDFGDDVFETHIVYDDSTPVTADGGRTGYPVITHAFPVEDRDGAHICMTELAAHICSDVYGRCNSALAYLSDDSKGLIEEVVLNLSSYDSANFNIDYKVSIHVYDDTWHVGEIDRTNFEE